MISDQTKYVDRAGDGSTTVFGFSPLVIFAASDLNVYLVDDANDLDNGTLLSQGTGSTKYSVSVAAYPGTGSITYPASGGSPLATGKFLRIIPNVPLTQPAQFEHQGGYTPKIVEQLFDKVIVRLKTAYERLDRALLVPRSSSSTPEDYLEDITATATAEATAQAAAAASSASNAATSASNAATSASSASSSASAAAASAVTAANAADNLKATSTTSLTIGTGSKTFVTQAGKAFQNGGWVVASSAAGPSNQMFGQITSYVGTSLEVNVTAIGGSGTLADWNIAVSGIQGVQGPAGSPGPGTGDVVGPASAVANRIVTFNGTTGKLIQDSGQLVTTAMSVLAGLTPAADRLPLFTGAGSAGLQAVTTDTKSLLAAADFAAVLALLGLVRPANGRVWYSSAGVLASSVSLDYDDTAGVKMLTTGTLKLDTTAGGTPSAIQTTLHAIADTSVTAWPGAKNASGFNFPLQPMIGSMWRTFWAYPSVTSYASIGGGTQGNWDTVSVFAPVPGAAWQGRNSRVLFQSAVAAGNHANVRTTGAALCAFRSASAGLGGFRTEIVFALENNVTGFQFFAGLAALDSFIPSDPSALVNCFGIDFEAGDANSGNFFLIHNDGSGTATRVNTGIARSALVAYRLVLECPLGNATALYWSLQNLHTGTIQSGSVNSNLPADGVPMNTHLNYRNGAVAQRAGIFLYSMSTHTPLN